MKLKNKVTITSKRTGKSVSLVKRSYKEPTFPKIKSPNKREEYYKRYGKHFS